MQISDILSREETRRHEFPVAARKVFLAHAGDAPLPRRVAQAIANQAELSTLDDQETAALPELLDRFRRQASGLLHCQPEEVSFVGPTSLALSLVAAGLRFRRNDNVLIYFDDYPSNVYPWMALASQGVEVRLMNVRGLGEIRPRDVLGQVDENTRLVALASAHFISGYRLQIDPIGQALRQKKIIFCLDAIQTLGAFPTTVEHVDILAADAHKWLMGPSGAGLLYMSRSLRERVDPPVYGWHNVRCPDYVAQERLVYADGPAKFEPGSHNLVGLAGLVAALELIVEMGVGAIAEELARKRAYLVPALLEKGCQVLQADAAPENASAILSFQKGSTDLADLHAQLTGKGIVTSLRADRKGAKYLRISPHYYNTVEELDRFLDAI